MKAETQSGEIIELPKECTCAVHDEPHWVYADRLWHEHNRKIMGDPPTFLGAMGTAIEEIARLQEKQRNFLRLRIVKLLDE